jgi:hypothetical protein
MNAERQNPALNLASVTMTDTDRSSNALFGLIRRLAPPIADRDSAPVSQSANPSQPDEEEYADA